jgi:hypothetical protein
MMHGDRLGSARSGWIMPGTALMFAIVMSLLAPSYERWFGPLPAFTGAFFAFYPLWIGLTALALLVAAVGAQFPFAARWPGLWRQFDLALSLASVLVVAAGIIALFLPVLLRPMPG